jgi:predicted nucleic acid-binding protein
MPTSSTLRHSDRIQEEWIRNLLLNRQDLKRESLERTKDAMNTAFPDANVTQYEPLIDGLTLPDPDDRHVLAAAIRGQADVILTFNLKDFPPCALAVYDIEVQDPDTFVAHLIELNRPKVLEAIQNLVKSLKNPQKTIEEVFETLENQGLLKSVDMLRNQYPVGIFFTI